MKIKFPKTDRLISLVAIMISILTLMIFVYQTNIINEQSRLSVKPRLVFSLKEVSNDSTLIMEQLIQNKGLGPALVKKAFIEYKGESFSLDFDNFIFSQFPDIEKYGNLLVTSGISEKTIILQNESITIYKVEIPHSKVPEIAEYLKLDLEYTTPNWNFILEYTSLYEDETWQIKEREHNPNQTDSKNSK